MMDFGLFFSAILGSAGLFGLIQFFVTRHDHKYDRMADIEKKVDRVGKSQDDMNLRLTRMELTNLIKDDPNNVDAVLQVAEYYFIELDGNAYAHALFEKWAVEHGVAIGWLPKITKGVKNGKKKKEE